MPTHLLLADESDLLLLGIETVLKDVVGLDVISQVYSVTELLNEMQLSSPDLILLGESLDPNLDIFDINNQLQRVKPQLRRLVIGSSLDGNFIRELLQTGVQAYLFKGDALKTCLSIAIQQVLKSTIYLSPTANSAYVTLMQSPLGHWKFDSKTRHILRCLVQGQTVKQIAHDSGLPAYQIYRQRRSLRKRFCANTNEELVARAISEGYARVSE